MYIVRPSFLLPYFCKGCPKSNGPKGWPKTNSDPKTTLTLTLFLTFRKLFLVLRATTVSQSLLGFGTTVGTQVRTSSFFST